MPKRKRKQKGKPPAESEAPVAAVEASAEASCKCFVCNKLCQTEAELENHVGSIHGPCFNCQCAHCTGKRRHDSTKLVEENVVKDGKNDVKIFSCIVCDECKVFLLCKCLSHIQTTHNTVSVQKQFECMKCNVGFEHCMELHTHMQTHSNAHKIARCGFTHCRKCFTTAAMLQNHLHVNHKIIKPYELLNNIKGTRVNPKEPNVMSLTITKQPASGSTSSSSATSAPTTGVESTSSAWLAPDPESPPRTAESIPDTNEPTNKPKGSLPQKHKLAAQTIAKIQKPPNSQLTCTICKKEHKSQISYNNHMLVFHKQKLSPTASLPKTKRRRCNNSDNSDVSSDLNSEDSDWEPSYTTRSSQSSSRAPRSSKNLSGSDSAANGSKTSPITSSTNSEKSETRKRNNSNSLAKLSGRVPVSGDTKASTDDTKANIGITKDSLDVINTSTTNTKEDATRTGMEATKVNTDVIQTRISATRANADATQASIDVTKTGTRVTADATPVSTDVSTNATRDSMNAKVQHAGHTQNVTDHECVACKQEKLLVPAVLNPIPLVKIKQEPIDEPAMTMPIISNVFSMTNSGGNNNVPNSIEVSKQYMTNPYEMHSSPPLLHPTVSLQQHSSRASVYGTAVSGSNLQLSSYHFESSDKRPASTGSSMYNGSSSNTCTSNTQAVTPNRDTMLSSPLSISPASNLSPSTGWQPSATAPEDQAASQDDCANCVVCTPLQNRCSPCGIIFMDTTMHMIHMGWHGKDHPFQCHTCGKICADKYSFTTHIFKSPHF